jgi:hypothetical protein
MLARCSVLLFACPLLANLLIQDLLAQAVDVLWFITGMLRVHMSFDTTVGLPLDNVTPPQSIHSAP